MIPIIKSIHHIILHFWTYLQGLCLNSGLSAVNSLVSDHPRCKTKWLLMGGDRLWEN